MNELKVLGAGFGRTGTRSVKVALDILGFGPCHHMFELHQNPEQAHQWIDVVVNKRNPDWSQLFSGFKSQMDWPGAHYWLELSQFYPNAKIILTVRDSESWFESISKTLKPYSELARRYGKEEKKNLAGMSDVFLEAVKRGKMEAITAYEEHNMRVRETIDPKRLLIFNLGDSWEPLCSFLNADIPDTPFPHTNSSAEFMAGAIKNLNN